MSERRASSPSAQLGNLTPMRPREVRKARPRTDLPDSIYALVAWIATQERWLVCAKAILLLVLLILGLALACIIDGRFLRALAQLLR